MSSYADSWPSILTKSNLKVRRVGLQGVKLLIAVGQLICAGQQQSYKLMLKGNSALKIFVNRLLSDEIGVVYSEYALLAVLIAIAVLGTVTLFGESVLNLWDFSLEAIVKFING